MRLKIKSFLNKNKNELIFSLIVFIFFLLISLLIPSTGDDWGNCSTGNLKVIINTAIGTYNSYEGRFFSRIFVLLLNHYKIIWCILNALSITIIFFIITKLIKFKNNKFMYLILLLLFILIDEETFSQIYVWVTGNITYLPPVLTIFILIYINKNIFENDKETKYNIAIYILLPIYVFITSIFVENGSIGIISCLILIIIYQFIKNKKINKFMIFNTLLSISGFLIMYLSPGTFNRSNEMGNEDIGMFTKIVNNFPRQMNYVFIKNSFAILLILFLIIHIIFKNIRGIKKYFLSIYISLLPLITIICNIYYILHRYNFKLFEYIMDCYNVPILLYWISFIIIILILLIKYYKFDKSKCLFFFLIALLNNGAMLLSPLGGGRTAFVSTMMLNVCIIILYMKFDIKFLTNKYYLYLLKGICSVVLFTFIAFYFKYFILNIKREFYIKIQLKEKKEIIEVIDLPNMYFWNPDPWDETHAIAFKNYYNIPLDKKIEIKKIWECDL